MENGDEKKKKYYDVARESEQIMQESSVSGKSMFFSCNLHDGEEFYRNVEIIGDAEVFYINYELTTYIRVENIDRE